MSILQKVKSFLKGPFNDNSVPEPEVQQKMEENGWGFEFDYVAVPHHIAVAVMQVTTPDGKKAFGHDQTEEGLKLYTDTLKSTRNSLGIKID